MCEPQRARALSTWGPVRAMMRCSVLGPTAPTPSSSLVSNSGLSLSGSSLTNAALVYCRLLFLSARVHQGWSLTLAEAR